MAQFNKNILVSLIPSDNKLECLSQNHTIVKFENKPVNQRVGFAGVGLVHDKRCSLLQKNAA
jgi:hypothetical protein